MLLNLLISKTILLGLLLLTVPFGIIAIFMAYDFWGLRIDSAFFPLGLIISLFMVFGFYFLGIFVLLSIFKDINDVMDFERYKEKMSRKLIKLGIDPIELEDVNITLNLGRHHLGKLKW